MIDWSKISNEKDFQRLVNHLFALECNSPSFIPSSPYIGFDKGWDGLFEGYYPFDKLEGLFSIQAKWTQKNFNEAEKALKTEINNEIKKAITNKVEHLRIATNAELRVDQVKELEGLKSDQIKSLFIWHRENLTIRIERQPFLRNFFFDDPQHPMLTPSDIYFSTIEKQLSDIHAGEIPSFKQYLTEVRNFILDQKDRILLLHGPGGFGKSHILKELASISYDCDSTRQLWVINSGYHNFESAIQKEIDQHQKYILVLDDADRNLQILNPLIAFVIRSGVDIKLIIGSRTSGIHILGEIFRQNKAGEYIRTTKIEEWPKDDLLKLLRLTAQKDPVKDEEMIINDFQNPYFIVLIGNQIRSAKKIDFKKLKTKIIDDIIEDTRKALVNLFQDKIDEFLIHLSCVVPFNFEDKRMLDHIGEQIGQSGDIIKRAIKLLLDSNILRQVGKAIRFAPDMKGDIYLLYKLEDLEKEYFKKIVLHWIPICSGNVFVNLGSTLKYGQDNIITSILEEFVSEWIETAQETNGTNRREKLKWLENVVSYVPSHCIELINAYLDTTPPEEKSFLNPDEAHVVKLNNDDYGPVIIGLIRGCSSRDAVIKITERIDELNLGGTYDNYKSHTLMKECVSPLRNKVEDIVETLNILEGWLQNASKTRSKLIKAALSEVLAASHEYTRSYLDKMEFGERHLRNTPEVIRMREKAIAILKKMLFLDDIEFQTAAIDAAEQIGRTRMGSISSRDMPLSNRFKDEREDVIKESSKLISIETDFRLLNDIEDMLLGWWARETPGFEEGVSLLRSFPKSPEYEIFRFYASRVEILENFSELESKAPNTNRWSWLVHNVMQKKWKMTAKDFEGPIQELSRKNDTLEKIANFLVDFYYKLANVNDHSYPVFISCWVNLQPEKFKELRKDNKLWSNISERFKSAIDYSLAENDSKYIEIIAGEILKDLSKASRVQVGTLLALIASRLPEERKEWLTTLITDGSDDIINMVTRELYFIHKEDQDINMVLELLMAAISNITEAGKVFVDNVAFVIKSLEKELRQHAKIEELVRLLYDLIKDRPKLEWDDQEIIEFCISDIDGLIDFLDYRLKKSKEFSSYSRFEAIPYDGIKHLNKSVKSFDDFKKFLSKTIEWHNVYSSGKEYYEVEKVLKPILLSRGLDKNSLYIGNFISELIENDDIDNVFVCMQYLPLNSETTDLFFRVCEWGVGKNKTNEIKSLLFSKTIPEGGWSSSHNEPPPALLEKKRIYESMHAKSDGILKVSLNKCIDSIEASIQDHLDRDKEFMTGR